MDISHTNGALPETTNIVHKVDLSTNYEEEASMPLTVDMDCEKPNEQSVGNGIGKSCGTVTSLDAGLHLEELLMADDSGIGDPETTNIVHKVDTSTNYEKEASMPLTVDMDCEKPNEQSVGNCIGKSCGTVTSLDVGLHLEELLMADDSGIGDPETTNIVHKVDTSTNYEKEASMPLTVDMDCEKPNEQSVGNGIGKSCGTVTSLDVGLHLEELLMADDSGIGDPETTNIVHKVDTSTNYEKEASMPLTVDMDCEKPNEQSVGNGIGKSCGTVTSLDVGLHLEELLMADDSGIGDPETTNIVHKVDTSTNYEKEASMPLTVDVDCEKPNEQSVGNGIGKSCGTVTSLDVGLHLEELLMADDSGIGDPETTNIVHKVDTSTNYEKEASMPLTVDVDCEKPNEQSVGNGIDKSCGTVTSLDAGLHLEELSMADDSGIGDPETTNIVHKVDTSTNYEKEASMPLTVDMDCEKPNEQSVGNGIGKSCGTVTSLDVGLHLEELLMADDSGIGDPETTNIVHKVDTSTNYEKEASMPLTVDMDCEKPNEQSVGNGIGKSCGTVTSLDVGLHLEELLMADDSGIGSRESHEDRESKEGSGKVFPLQGDNPCSVQGNGSTLDLVSEQYIIIDDIGGYADSPYNLSFAEEEMLLADDENTSPLEKEVHQIPNMSQTIVTDSSEACDNISSPVNKSQATYILSLSGADLGQEGVDIESISKKIITKTQISDTSTCRFSDMKTSKTENIENASTASDLFQVICELKDNVIVPYQKDVLSEPLEVTTLSKCPLIDIPKEVQSSLSIQHLSDTFIDIVNLKAVPVNDMNKKDLNRIHLDSGSLDSQSEERFLYSENETADFNANLDELSNFLDELPVPVTSIQNLQQEEQKMHLFDESSQDSNYSILPSEEEMLLADDHDDNNKKVISAVKQQRSNIKTGILINTDYPKNTHIGFGPTSNNVKNTLILDGSIEVVSTNVNVPLYNHIDDNNLPKNICPILDNSNAIVTKNNVTDVKITAEINHKETNGTVSNTLVQNVNTSRCINKPTLRSNSVASQSVDEVSVDSGVSAPYMPRTSNRSWPVFSAYPSPQSQDTESSSISEDISVKAESLVLLPEVSTQLDHGVHLDFALEELHNTGDQFKEKWKSATTSSSYSGSTTSPSKGSFDRPQSLVQKSVAKKAWQEIFVSSDPLENLDNFDPEWDKLRNLFTTEERYRALKERWKNLYPPNPNKNLTSRLIRVEQSPALGHYFITHQKQNTCPSDGRAEALRREAYSDGENADCDQTSNTADDSLIAQSLLTAELELAQTRSEEYLAFDHAGYTIISELMGSDAESGPTDKQPSHDNNFTDVSVGSSETPSKKLPEMSEVVDIAGTASCTSKCLLSPCHGNGRSSFSQSHSLDLDCSTTAVQHPVESLHHLLCTVESVNCDVDVELSDSCKFRSSSSQQTSPGVCETQHVTNACDVPQLVQLNQAPAVCVDVAQSFSKCTQIERDHACCLVGKAQLGSALISSQHCQNDRTKDCHGGKKTPSGIPLVDQTSDVTVYDIDFNNCVNDVNASHSTRATLTDLAGTFSRKAPLNSKKYSSTCAPAPCSPSDVDQLAFVARNKSLHDSEVGSTCDKDRQNLRQVVGEQSGNSNINAKYKESTSKMTVKTSDQHPKRLVNPKKSKKRPRDSSDDNNEEENGRKRLRRNTYMKLYDDLIGRAKQTRVVQLMHLQNMQQRDMVKLQLQQRQEKTQFQWVQHFPTQLALYQNHCQAQLALDAEYRRRMDEVEHAYMTRFNLLERASEELSVFYNFYKGVCNENSSLLTDEEVQEMVEVEESMNSYSQVYK